MCPLLSPVLRFQLSCLVAWYTYRLTSIHDQPIQTFDRDAHLVQFVTTIQSIPSPFNPVRGLGASSSVHRQHSHHLSTPSPIDLIPLSPSFFPLSRRIVSRQAYAQPAASNAPSHSGGSLSLGLEGGSRDPRSVPPSSSTRTRPPFSSVLCLFSSMNLSVTPRHIRPFWPSDSTDHLITPSGHPFFATS